MNPDRDRVRALIGGNRPTETPQHITRRAARKARKAAARRERDDADRIDDDGGAASEAMWQARMGGDMEAF